MSKTFKNPIIPGFYPDPSIYRVGEDYYLVTSTFECFPGLPIFHSRGLVNWRQIDQCQPVAKQIDGRILSTPVASGFVGAYIGMYASSSGLPSNNKAAFDWFEYNS